MVIHDRLVIQVAEWRRVINDCTCLQLPLVLLVVRPNIHRAVQKPRCDGSLGGWWCR